MSKLPVKFFWKDSMNSIWHVSQAYEIHCDGLNNISKAFFDMGGTFGTTAKENEIIACKSTGLKDKKGKGEEIYQDDMVSIKKSWGSKVQEGRVIQHQDSWVVVDENGDFISGLWDAIHNYKGKIVGNFYEKG